MYTKQALYELGIKPSAITDTQKRQLDEQGYIIVENVLTPSQVQNIRDEFERIHAEEAGQGGHEVHVEPGARRLSNIFNKSNAFDVCLNIPEVLAAAHYMLGEIKVHGANLRDPNKQKTGTLPFSITKRKNARKNGDVTLFRKNGDVTLFNHVKPKNEKTKKRGRYPFQSR